MTAQPDSWFTRAIASLLEQRTGPSTKLDHARNPGRRLQSSTRHHTTHAERVRKRKAQHLARRKQRS